MRKIIFIWVFFLITQPLLATSIVVLISSNYIIIGADSKRMIIDAETNITVNETVCKIKMWNNYCFAQAGLVASNSTGFSAEKIINDELAKTTSINKAVRQIQKSIGQALEKELVYQKMFQPKQYLKSLESSDHLLEIVLLRVVNNQPQAHIIGFEFKNEKKIKVSSYTTNCGAACTTSGTKLVFLGEYSGMEKYLNAPDVNKDPVALVNQLILSQSKITPRSVGAPISLAKINGSGMEWIKQQCE